MTHGVSAAPIRPGALVARRSMWADRPQSLRYQERFLRGAWGMKNDAGAPALACGSELT